MKSFRPHVSLSYSISDYSLVATMTRLSITIHIINAAPSCLSSVYTESFYHHRKFPIFQLTLWRMLILCQICLSFLCSPLNCPPLNTPIFQVLLWSSMQTSPSPTFSAEQPIEKDIQPQAVYLSTLLLNKAELGP